MDCYYSKMHTFRHFLFLNHIRKFGNSNFCKTLKFLHSSKVTKRDIYSVAYALQISSHNSHNSRGTDFDFRRAWIHTSGRRLMADMNNSSISSTSESSSESGNGNGGGSGPYSYMKKKPGKCKTHFVCSYCGESSRQWWGHCPSCKKGNTMQSYTEDSVSGGSSGGGPGARAAEVRISGFNSKTVFRDKDKALPGWVVNRLMANNLQPQRLSDVTQGLNEEQWRIPLTGPFGREVGRVLGGGLIPGSLILIGGDPGVGKSSLLLQMSAILSEGCEVNLPAPVLYVSGEESVQQIGSRASRMQIETKDLFLYSSTNLEDILDKIHELGPRAVVVDSIQTVYLREATGNLGSITQVRECATALLRCAKRTQIPIFLVGHVTKSGDIAGPRVLEHVVDVVLYLEGDRLLSHRILRSVKNRFGSTDEIGVLEMGQNGLQAITNASELYITERDISQDVLVGLALTVILDGKRPFLIETQALCCIGTSSGTTIMRRFNGIEDKRATIIIAVLGKQVGLDLHESSIFLNVVGGVRVEETAADLAIAASICSSFLEIPIPLNMAFIGEIGLGGELRTVARMDKRINELAKLGFTKCVIPASSMKSITGLEWDGLSIIQCKNLKEVIKKVFKSNLKPIPNVMRVEVEVEGEAQQKGGSGDSGEGMRVEVEVEGEAQQKGGSGDSGEGEQKSTSEGAGEQRSMSESVAIGEQQGVSVSAGLGENEQSGGVGGGSVSEQTGGSGVWGEGEQKSMSEGAPEQRGMNESVGTNDQQDVSVSAGLGANEQRGWIKHRDATEQKGGGNNVGEKKGGGYVVGELKSGDKHWSENGQRGRVGDVNEQNGERRRWIINEQRGKHGGVDGQNGRGQSGARSVNWQRNTSYHQRQTFPHPHQGGRY